MVYLCNRPRQKVVAAFSEYYHSAARQIQNDRKEKEKDFSLRKRQRAREEKEAAGRRKEGSGLKAATADLL